MKKILALILLVLILVGTFAACDIVEPEFTEKKTERNTEKNTEKDTEKNTEKKTDKATENDKSNIGLPGKDGITPQIRINSTTSEWEVSYDNGKTWKSLGVKAAPDSDSTDINEYGLDFYPLPDGTYGVKGGKSLYLSKIVIPDVYNGKAVTKILDEAFKDAYNLSEIILPDTTVSIESSAFENCRNLVSINFPPSLTLIGSSAFKECEKLTNIVLPNSLTTISDSAFYNCYKIKSITFPDSITTIGSHAFYCTGLTSITITKNINYIGSSAFSECFSLKSAEFKNTEGWAAYSNPSYSGGETISSTDLADKETAAKLLIYSNDIPDYQGYCYYTWKRS